MDPVELRVARPADADAVEEYHHRCFLSTYAAQVAAGEFGPPERTGTRQQLHARVENVAAIAFYESQGWTVTDRLIHTVEHGISYAERVLVKHLR
jgi:hypothetical protein